METEATKQKKKRQDVQEQLRRFKTELHEIFLVLDDPKKLAEGVKRLYQRHVTVQDKTNRAGVEDIHKNYQRQRAYLERGVDGLDAKIKKDEKVVKKDKLRIMQENIVLTKELNSLRREMQMLEVSQSSGEQAHADLEEEVGNAQRAHDEHEIAMQHEQIRALKNQLSSLQQAQAMQTQTMQYSNRTATGEMLQPMAAQ